MFLQELSRYVEPSSAEIEGEILPEVEHLQGRAQGIGSTECCRRTAPVEKEKGFPDGIGRVMAVPGKVTPAAERAEAGIVAESCQQAVHEGEGKSCGVKCSTEGDQDRVA